MTNSTLAAASFDTGSAQLDLERVPAVEGPDGVSVGSLLSKTGVVTYDPGFTNTAACRSQITYIDGAAGILRYRGYPIEQLAEHSSYIETAYLLCHGELPTRTSLPSGRRGSCATLTYTTTTSG